jgi:hypothetical protein
MNRRTRGWRWAVYITATLLLAGSAGARADSSSSVLLTLSADRDAVCAGAVHNDVHQAHLLATVTDPEGQPLAGKVVTFSANHGFVKVGPSFDPPAAITDSAGEAGTVLTSGDEIMPGTVTARCEGAESSVPMAFERVDMTFDFLDPTTGRPGRCDIADGASQEKVVAHLTWRGQPVPGHHITWQLIAWLLTNPNAFGKDETADYIGLGKPPFGSLSPSAGVTDGQGLAATVFTEGIIGDHRVMRATDVSVWVDE